MAAKMFKKYNKYWNAYVDMNPVMFFAMLLDPREKEKGLEFALQCLYEKDLFKVDTVMRQVKQDFKILFEEYKYMHSMQEEVSTGSLQSQQSTSSKGQGTSMRANLLSRKKRHKSNPSSEVGKTELDRYLMEKVVGNDSDDDGEEEICEEETDFDILDWWKNNSSKYKILAHMAKDILAIPVSYVASESAFSTGKRVLTPCRSSLSTRTVEALLCTQSWLRKPIKLDLLTEFLPEDNAEIEEELLGPLTCNASISTGVSRI